MIIENNVNFSGAAKIEELKEKIKTFSIQIREENENLKRYNKVFKFGLGMQGLGSAIAFITGMVNKLLDDQATESNLLDSKFTYAFGTSLSLFLFGTLTIIANSYINKCDDKENNKIKIREFNNYKEQIEKLLTLIANSNDPKFSETKKTAENLMVKIQHLVNSRWNNYDLEHFAISKQFSLLNEILQGVNEIADLMTSVSIDLESQPLNDDSICSSSIRNYTNSTVIPFITSSWSNPSSSERSSDSYVRSTTASLKASNS